MMDLTRSYKYEKLIKEEIEHYGEIEVTDDLTEGGANDNPTWHYYWNRVHAVIATTEFANIAAYLSRTVPTERSIEILSLGSGYCGHELKLARSLSRPYTLRCTDINENLFVKAKEAVRTESLSVEFEVADLNFIQLQPKRYDLIFAHASIHHVINLEHLLDQVAQALTSHGIFQLVEVVGKDRTLIWDENQRMANALLAALPKRITGGLLISDAAPAKGVLGRIKRDAKRAVKKIAFVKPLLEGLGLIKVDGMEGIRQSEIVDQLRQRFTPLFELRHGAFMRRICKNPALAACFDPNNREALQFLEFLIDADEAAVNRGVLRPLEIWGIYRPRGSL
jgi:SAM-dependent methyltransferase